MSRVAGILMPITSLPGKYGIGCFSKEAYAFIDWLVMGIKIPATLLISYSFV